MATIGLVGCSKSKLSSRALARDLYSPSALFRGRLNHVERTCDRWLILSAKHGLVEPSEELDPYDVALVEAPRVRKREWAARVLDQLRERFEEVRGKNFEIHAGHDY